MSAATQFVRYLAVAALSAASDWVVFVALFAASGAPIPAQATSRIAGALVSFGVNKYWSFQSPEHRRALIEGPRFLALFVASYALALTSFSGLTIAGVAPYVAKLATDSLGFLFNFLMMRLWVYRPRPANR